MKTFTNKVMLMGVNAELLLKRRELLRKMIDSARNGNELSISSLRAAIVDTTNAAPGWQIVLISEMIFNDIDGVIKGIADAN